jgi:hypothetical protein
MGHEVTLACATLALFVACNAAAQTASPSVAMHTESDRVLAASPAMEALSLSGAQKAYVAGHFGRRPPLRSALAQAAKENQVTLDASAAKLLEVEYLSAEYSFAAGERPPAQDAIDRVAKDVLTAYIGEILSSDKPRGLQPRIAESLGRGAGLYLPQRHRYGRIRVDFVPAAPQVFEVSIDDLQYDAPPALFVVLEGEHRVAAEVPGYPPCTNQITVPAGKLASLECRLARRR